MQKSSNFKTKEKHKITTLLDYLRFYLAFQLTCGLDRTIRRNRYS